MLNNEIKPRKMERRRQNLACKSFTLLLFGILILIYSNHYKKIPAANAERNFLSRRLLDTNSSQEKTCVYSSGAAEEFPADLFSQNEREKGAILFHIIMLFYTFGLLAVVCDDYFVLSLYHICSRLKLDKDVAGATFMAIGSSAPTLFISIVSIFFAENAGDVGLGTVVGSTIFNTLFITGVCAMAVSTAMPITCWPLLRDSFAYTIGTFTLVFTVQDRVVHWWEASLFIVIYLFYILIMCFNKPLSDLFTKLSETCCGMPCGEISVDDTKLIPFELSQAVEEKYHKSETGHQEKKEKKKQGTIEDHSADTLNVVKGEFGLYEYKQDLPFQLPEGIMSKIIWFLGFPVMILFYITIPPCCKEKWSEWFLVTFVMSVLWMGGLSYILVWMVCIIGETFNIPDCIMGMTFLAAGSSIPDVMASVIVIRQGSCDMAFSNAIGSNVFDMLCLGVPWLIKTLVFEPGTVVQIESQSIMISSLLLIGSIVFLVTAIHLNDWKLDKKLGIMFLTVYIVFITLATLLEFLACPCQIIEIMTF